MNKLLWILLQIIGIIFSSCNGENSSTHSKSSKKDIAPGKSVSEPDQSISAIYQDRNSNFWFGSKENGVFYYDGKKLTRFTKEDGLIGNQIREIQEDKLVISL